MTGPRSRPATIIDVAEAAGVSRQTVTRAMNDMPGISAATKSRVLAAAAELAYRPSRYGRGLVGHTQRTIGLVVDDLTNPYYPQLASAVVTSATARGWNVVLAQRAGAADERALLAELAAQSDAVIGYPRLDDDGARAALVGMPFVRIDAAGQTFGGGVELDVAAAAADLVRHLLARGVRRPGLLDVSRDEQPSGRGRRLLEELAAREVPVVRLACEGRSFASGAAGTRALLQQHPDLDAIVAFNDMMACGALKALHEAGVRVPEQVRVTGCDGLDLGRYVHPELTTLEVDMTEVAEAAVGMAIDMHAGTLPLDGTRVRVLHQLVVRGST